MMTIASIAWPEDSRDAISLYLRFLVSVVDYFRIPFPLDGPNPIPIVKDYLSGDINEMQYRESANQWWAVLDTQGNIREVQESAVLRSRLAICLLSATQSEHNELGEHLSWFFEVLENLGFSLVEPIAMMKNHFPRR